MSRIWVASAMPGVEDLLRNEIQRVSQGRTRFLPSPRPDEHHFLTDLPAARLANLALCHALHVRLDFPVQRPRGLMSPEHLRALVEHVHACAQLTPDQGFGGLRFDAAGANSPTFQRLAAAVEAELGLRHNPHDGDLVITLRPGNDGWEVLCRVGNRPLSARAWRRMNYQGSLNANFAAAMVELSEPRRSDRFLNAMCGSGTILIERVRRMDATLAVGIDCSREALAAARLNSKHARVDARLQWLHADMGDPPLAGPSFDVICADLPWGRSHGERATNSTLYSSAFRSWDRVSAPGARLVLLTEDIESLQANEEEISRRWRLVEERRFDQRGFQPTCRLYSRIGD